MIWLTLFLLLAFYLFLAATNPVEPATERWPPFARLALDLRPPFASCSVPEDCTPTEMCMSFHGELFRRCVPRFRGPEPCNPATGRWILSKQPDGGLFASCECLDSHLVTQKAEGLDCNIDVACGTHGHLASLDLEASCVCDEGYVPERVEKRPSCRRLLPSEVVEEPTRDCPDNYVPMDEAKLLYHPDYWTQFEKTSRCLRKPCSFDALTGADLHFTEYDKNLGCICRAEHGNFGVRFEGGAAYLLYKDGYHACVNIFGGRETNSRMKNVKLYTHFYVRDQEPVSFIHYTDLDPQELQPVFREMVANGILQIREPWPHNYTQFILKSQHPLLKIHTRACQENAFFGTIWCNENLITERYAECDRIGGEPNLFDTIFAMTKNKFKVHLYNILYSSPVCRYRNPSSSRYHGHVVLNPYIMSIPNNPVLRRSNVVVLSPTSVRAWDVDLDNDSRFHAMKESSRYPIVPDTEDSRRVRRIVAAENNRLKKEIEYQKTNFNRQL